MTGGKQRAKRMAQSAKRNRKTEGRMQLAVMSPELKADG